MKKATQVIVPKIVFLDIENAPNMGYTWGKYEQNVIEYTQPWFILCISWMWLGGKVQTTSLPDFPLYKKDKTNDKEIMQIIWDVLNEADIVVAHNGARFDLRKINARFIHHGMKPPSRFKVVDTLKVARRYFQFDSNRLDDLGKYLGLGEKLETGGFELFKDCMEGDMKAWSKMIKYNQQDIYLLESLYLRFRPWIDTHPVYDKLTDEPKHCVICSSEKIQRRGKELMTNGNWKFRYQCQDCGKWFYGKKQNHD